jgi:uncharacterized protein
MKELVEYLVKALVDKPDQVNVTQTDGEQVTVVEIKVADDDAGKVIGKEGRIANAIRTLVKAAGAKSRKRVTVEIMTGKRVVMVKAIVTEAFKSNLTQELERAIKNLDGQAQQMDFQAKTYMEDMKKKGMVSQMTAFKHQLDEEKGRQTAARADLMAKIEEAKKLVLNTEFVQGPLEGPITVAMGDNLYKKIGAAEIIVKDGVIQEIRNA